MKFKSTFDNDFAAAEPFGVAAVRETYNRIFDEWKGNLEYLTELSIVLNLRLWDHSENRNFAMADVYEELWGRNDQWCLDNLHGEDRVYYLRTTD